MARNGVDEYLTNLAPRVDEKANDTLRRLYEERMDVFNMADMLFQLFFPLTFHGPTTGKYWGALNRLMKARPNIMNVDKETVANANLTGIDARTRWRQRCHFNSPYRGQKRFVAVDARHSIISKYHVVCRERGSGNYRIAS